MLLLLEGLMGSMVLHRYFVTLLLNRVENVVIVGRIGLFKRLMNGLLNY